MDDLAEASRTSYSVLLSHQELFWSQFRTMKQDASWHRHKRGWSWNVGHGNCLEQDGEESQAVCQGKKIDPEDLMGCPLLSHKAGTPAHLCFGLWEPCADLSLKNGRPILTLCVAAGSEDRFGSHLSMTHDLGDFSQQSAALPELELYPITMDFK